MQIWQCPIHNGYLKLRVQLSILHNNQLNTKRIKIIAGIYLAQKLRYPEDLKVNASLKYHA